jgi:hypothetical protein
VRKLSWTTLAAMLAEAHVKQKLKLTEMESCPISAVLTAGLLSF